MYYTEAYGPLYTIRMHPVYYVYVSNDTYAIIYLIAYDPTRRDYYVLYLGRKLEKTSMMLASQTVS